MTRTWSLAAAAFPDALGAPLWADEMLGPALTLTQSTLQNFGFWVEQTTPADLQELTIGCLVAAVAYDLSIVYVKKSNAGKLDVYANNTLISSANDLYAAANTYSQVISIPVTFPTPGWNKIKLKVNGKNASSSNYAMPLTGIGFLLQAAPTFGLLTLNEAAMPRRTSLFFKDFTQTAGAGHIMTPNTSMQFFHYAADNSAASGDAWRTSVWIQAGTYTFAARGFTDANCGQCAWGLDDVDFITNQDWYSAGLVYNVLKTGTVIVPTSGRHKITMRVTGKHASSTDFYTPIVKTWLYQAAD